MFSKIVSFWLAVTGRKHISRYFESILKLGTRGPALESRLLLDQGMWVVLSGANTTAALQASGRFVLPYWLEKQWNPHSPSFIPTGAGLLTANLSHRNWTSLGLPGVPDEIMVDPVGMVSPRPESESYLPYLRVNGTTLLVSRRGATNQKFCTDTRNVVTNYPTENGVKLTCQTSVAFWENSICANLTLHIVNSSELFSEVQTGLAMRPYNTLTVGHVHSVCRAHENVLEVSGATGLVAKKTPNRIVVAKRNQEDPLCGGKGLELGVSESLQSESGLLFANVEYDLTLAPGACAELTFLIPATKSFSHTESIFARSNLKCDMERRSEDALKYAQKYETPSTQIWLSHESTENLYNTSKAHLAAFDDGEAFCPGSYLYHHSWLRDGYFLMQSAMNAGTWRGMRKKCRAIITAQKRNGLFKNAPGEWDGNGQGIGTLVECCQKLGDKTFLAECYPAIQKAAHWIHTEQQKNAQKDVPHAGLLPMGFSAEHLGTIDSYFWDAFWGLYGIRMAAWAATELGHSQDHAKFETWNKKITDEIKKCIWETLNKSHIQILPASPYRLPDAGSIGCLAAACPLALSDITEPWLSPTIEFLMNEYMKDGLFFHSIFHTGLNPYLSAQIARVLLARGDERWLSIFNALISHASPTGTWPEAINPLTKGGCMGDGHHGWANAEYITLLRNAFVLEEENHILLGHGIPLAWITENRSCGVANASTRFGTLHFEVRLQENEIIYQWKLVRNEFRSSEHAKVFLSIPSCLSVPNTSSRGSRKLKEVDDTGEFALVRQ